MVFFATKRLFISSAVLLLSFFPCLNVVNALFEDEAGKSDFLVTFTGHGPVRFVHTTAATDAVVTSDGTSCNVAARNMKDGTLLWRRNVCASVSSSSSLGLILLGASNHVVTLEPSTGTIRAWHVETGALVWDRHIVFPVNSFSSPSTLPKLSIIRAANKDQKDQKKKFVVVTLAAKGGGKTYYLDAKTGTFVETEPGDRDAEVLSTSKTLSATAADSSSLTVVCKEDDFNLEVEFQPATRTFQVRDGKGATMVLDLSEDDEVVSVDLLRCNRVSMSLSALASTRRGTTTQLTFTPTSANKDWAKEEVVSFSTGILLDVSHDVGDLISSTGSSEGKGSGTSEEEETKNLLLFSSRFQQQWKQLQSSLVPWAATSTGGVDRRDQTFGFLKVAVLLSPSVHRLFGMDTTGKHRGQFKYQVDLPAHAQWHRLVHGTHGTVNAAHGNHGGTHSRELLVLSSTKTPNKGKDDDDDGTGSRMIDWLCVDGMNGFPLAKGTVSVPSGVVQIIPLQVTAPKVGHCRQSAMIVLKDRTTVLVPGDKVTTASARKLISASNNDDSGSNGLYAHAIQTNAASLESFRISKSKEEDEDDAYGGTQTDHDHDHGGGSATNNNIRLDLIGSTAFPGEHVVAAAYPSRNEVIQSPCNVLGDESLLLKYLNPHFVVLVTMSDDDGDGNNNASKAKDPFAAAFNDANRKKTGAVKKRKPVGATASGAEAQTVVADEDTPNLFVNLVDTVSGRIIYRASHTNGEASPSPSVLISENWVFYSFVNQKTRRAELGVLSLYEGMIGNKGITAFTSPEQSDSFSSLDARESKPVVLAKTFSLAKPVTALGITTTRGGISSRRLLLSSTDGQLLQVDRKILEPRRPVGEVKESEKKEGLRQYSELIPTVSYMSLSYNQTLESVHSIVTSSTDLESQTMVLAFGGPDVFFVRTSPSRGFDLLPENFSRTALSVIVAGLFAACVVARKMASKKISKQGWV